MEKSFELIEPGEGEFYEKGSKFIGLAKIIESEAKAKALIAEQKALHPKANHLCYAYRLRIDKAVVENLSDDGEPTHSAGQPILKQIRSARLENCLIIVVRYFGGVKLGVGGLIKAYRQGAVMALGETKKALVIPHTVLSFSVPYSVWGEVLAILDKEQLRFEAKHSSEGAIIRIKVEKRNADHTVGLFKALKIEAN